MLSFTLRFQILLLTFPPWYDEMAFCELMQCIRHLIGVGQFKHQVVAGSREIEPSAPKRQATAEMRGLHLSGTDQYLRAT